MRPTPTGPVVLVSSDPVEFARERTPLSVSTDTEPNAVERLTTEPTVVTLNSAHAVFAAIMRVSICCGVEPFAIETRNEDRPSTASSMLTPDDKGINTPCAVGVV